MKTKMLTKADVEKKWYLIDANGLVLGRLASQIANILRGKDKPSFTPNADTGDYVVVINSDKIVLTGNKLEQKYHFKHTAYTGNYTQTQYKKLMEENSPEALRLAVKGMMPKNNLSRAMMKKLFIYKDENHAQTAQKPEKLVLKEIVK